MKDIVEIYDNYHKLGIKNRIITEGEEINLVREYVEFRKNEFCAKEDRKLAVFLEAKVDNAYPDIVFVEYNPENYLNWNTTRDKLIKADLKVLYHIYAKKEIDATDLVAQLGITWKEAMLSVEKLFDSELITRRNKSWVILDEERISTYKIEAVEAKLNKWEQVLQQSIINKNFASESYALSICKARPKEDVLNKFKKFGVGVYLKSQNGFEIVKKAKSKEIPVSFNSIFFNEWVGRIINNKEGLIDAIR